MRGAQVPCPAGRSERLRILARDSSTTCLRTPPTSSPGDNAPKPSNLLAVPIQRRPLFPGFMAPLVVTDEALVEAMIAVKKTSSPFVGVFLVKDAAVDLTVDRFSLTSVDQIYSTGTLAHIQQMEVRGSVCGCEIGGESAFRTRSPAHS